MGKITFILGGARSGKSQFALKIAKGKGTAKVAFIATCQALDDEMDERIKLHKKLRPGQWATFEEPLRVAAVVKKIRSEYDFILIDCLTLLVTNLLLKKKTPEEIKSEVGAIIDELKKHKGSSVIVSNEVGLGIVPNTRLGREFRDIAGQVNKIVAQRSNKVFFMVSGMPLKINPSTVLRVLS